MNAPALRREMIAPNQNEARNHAPEREPWDCPLDGSPTGHDAPNEGNVVLPMDATGTPAPASPVVSIGEKLFDSIHTFLQRFIAFPTPASLDTVTLWAAHAHMVKHFHTTPRLAMLSPEAVSGKTRVLELLDLLTPNPMLILSPSPAAIFRTLAKKQITLLFDEVDTVFTSRGRDDQNQDLRALLNAGYRRGASIPRCVGPNHDVTDFKVFGAVALAGIGNLPDTILTRSIVIRMRRRSATEHIEEYRVRLNQAEGHALREQLAEWAEFVGLAAGCAFPSLPEGVVDRRAEAWEPLIAVADAAGGSWPDRARVAAVADVAAYRGHAPSLGIKLLTDLHRVFSDSDSLSTAHILRLLNGMDESPWGEINGKPLDSRGLAAQLKGYGVKPTNIRNGHDVHKGYNKADFNDAWERYLPVCLEPATSATSATNDDSETIQVEV